MSVEGSIQNGSKSLYIFFIDPNFNLVLNIFFVQLLFPFKSAIDKPDCVIDIEFKQIFFITKTKMMENGIALVVFVLSGVDGRVLFKVFLDFEYVSAAENKLGDLFLALHYYR